MATKKLSLPPDVNDTTERFPRQSTHRVIRVPRSMPSEDDLRRIKGNRLKDVLLSIAFGAGITAGITGLMVAIAYIMLRM